VHLVGVIIKKFVTMHGYTNVKYYPTFRSWCTSVFWNGTK